MNALFEWPKLLVSLGENATPTPHPLIGSQTLVPQALNPKLPGMSLKTKISNSLWLPRMVSKIILGNVPFVRAVAHKTGLFRWGQMQQATYALQVFRLHMTEAFPQGLPAGFTALELGPGDSIASAIIAKAYGCGKIYLSDAGNYVSRDMGLYRRIARELKREGLPNVGYLDSINTFDQLLTALNAEYLPNGLADLQRIPAGSVDFIWSHSVLEHVRKRDFDATMRETRRVLASRAGRISHNVDMKDHLGQALNNLRFSDALWESDWMARSGFYTNRLRASELLAAFARSGLVIEKSGTGKWQQLPTPRSAMAAPFNAMSDDDLLAPTLAAVLKHAA